MVNTLRNYGVLILKANPQNALEYLQKAATILPTDQQTLYGYATCLAALGRFNDADTAFNKAIEISPYTQIAELSRSELTKIAARNLSGSAGGQLRMDAVMYCLAALELFAKVGPETRQRVSFEIALLGRSGLDINDPTPKYRLSSLGGTFTGFQLVSYMYVGFQQMNPGMDAGIDLSKEYTAARELLEQKR